MTRQTPSPETIRTERAFQIYVSSLNSDLNLPHNFEEHESTDKEILTGLRNFVRFSYEAADIFIAYQPTEALDECLVSESFKEEPTIPS